MTEKLEKIDFYYYSPTGGTKKAGMLTAEGLTELVYRIDLGQKGPFEPGDNATALFALPVFSGRLPAFAAEKIKQLDGTGKTAVTMVVYGVRAYEDALLELNDLVRNAGFKIAGSAAVIARHSIVPEVGAGRPNEQDKKELVEFGQKALQNIDDKHYPELNIPGNRPYKDLPNNTNTPICTDECTKCGVCINSCALGAISLQNKEIITDAEPCILCMACVAACPMKARILPEPVQAGTNAKLSPLKEIYRENEFFI